MPHAPRARSPVPRPSAPSPPVSLPPGVHCVPERLARLERRCFRRRNRNALASPRIAARAGAAALRRKRAEAGYPHRLLLRQRLGDHLDTVSTAPSAADLLSLIRPATWLMMSALFIPALPETVSPFRRDADMSRRVREVNLHRGQHNLPPFVQYVLCREAERYFDSMCALRPFGVGEVMFLDLPLLCDQVAVAHRADAPALDEPSLHFGDVGKLTVRPDCPTQRGTVAPGGAIVFVSAHRVLPQRSGGRSAPGPFLCCLSVDTTALSPRTRPPRLACRSRCDRRRGLRPWSRLWRSAT